MVRKDCTSFLRSAFEARFCVPMLLYRGAALAIAATKVSAGLKLDKATIASSKTPPCHDKRCHERNKLCTTPRSDSVLQRIPMQKCEFWIRVRVSTFRLCAFFMRIPMRKRESTFRHPFGDYNIIKG